MGHGLNYSIPDCTVIDAFRYVVILTGGMMAGRVIFMLMTGWMRVWRWRRMMGMVAYTAGGLFGVLQETDQLSRPMLVWRLPLLLLITVPGFISVWFGGETDSSAPLRPEFQRLHREKEGSS